MTTAIKFGTDGWRAIIADDYTIENLSRVAAATGKWIKENFDNPSAVVGYDCRFGGKLFAETTARVLASEGVKVVLSSGFSSTPMVSLATLKLDTSCGIIITASHNPPSYNGFKIKGNYGGPALPEMIDAIEKNIEVKFDGPFDSLEGLIEQGRIEYKNLEDLYVSHAESSFDLDAIRRSGIRVGYDAMYGAGQRTVARLLPYSVRIHDDFNPSFKGVSPEPILKNMQEFVDLIRKDGKIDFAFATDGDADRIGLLDSKGNFIDSHHIILMLVNYLYKYKGMKGKVVNSFSCTSRISRLCEAFGLENITTKIGFKYICGYMIDDHVLVGGEESGGIAVDKHIPERDGVWIALTLLEYMAIAGKSLAELIKEVYDVVGPFALERYDLHVTEEDKKRIAEEIRQGTLNKFGSYEVQKIEDLDGHKFHLGDGKWVMIRASGTEPVLRIYAEADNHAEAVRILDSTQARLFERNQKN